MEALVLYRYGLWDRNCRGHQNVSFYFPLFSPNGPKVSYPGSLKSQYKRTDDQIMLSLKTSCDQTYTQFAAFHQWHVLVYLDGWKLHLLPKGTFKPQRSHR